MHKKNSAGIFFFFLFLTCFFTGSNAQVTVVRSENKVTIEGKVFFMHVVKAGQTLYSISRAYNVSEQAVINENPGITSGLQIGRTLKIPASTSTVHTPVVNLQPAVQIVVPPDTSYPQHVVKQGETMYSISKLYNINIQDLERANPAVVNHEIRTGQLIYIPIKTILPKPEEFLYHKVRRRETIYGIARKYKISEEQLKQYNPELYDKHPKKDQVLKIPKIFKTPVEQVHKPEFPGDTIKSQLGNLYDTLKIAGNYAFYLDSLPEITGRALNIAYLIPFNYRKVEEVQPDETIGKTRDDILNLEHQENPDDQMLSSRNFLEFLEGSLLAIDSLKNKGITINVFIFDTRKSPSRTREIIYSRNFDKIDLIIGPFYSYEVEIVSEYSLQNRIPMISPLSGELGPIQYNPFFFQLNTGYKTEFEYIADFATGFTDKNLIFIHAADSLDTLKYDYLREKLQKKHLQENPGDSLFLTEYVYDRMSKANLSLEIPKLLSKEKENLVIMPETDEAFVSSVVTQLYFQLKNFDISVIGMPHWYAFQNVDFLYYHKLSLSYFTPYYFSYDSANIRHFLKDYRKTFYAEPVTLTKKGGSYAFLGYDLSYHFLHSMSKYGKRFILHLNDTGGKELMNDFYFVPLSEKGGFENQSLVLVKFTEDLEVKAEPYKIVYPLEMEDYEEIPEEIPEEVPTDSIFVE